MSRIPLFMLFALVAGGLTVWGVGSGPAPTVAAEPKLEVLEDVVFGTGGDVDLRLDLARPATSERPLPAVLVFHGGGWVQGNKAQFRPLARFLAEEGYFGATVQYRLARPGPGNPAPWPAQIEDAKCAVRWLRANAKRYNVDPDRIAALGFSAGAHLAMLLGTMDPQDGLEGTGGCAEQSSKVNAVVAFYGPTDMGLPPPANRLDLPKLSAEERSRVLRGMALAAVLGREFGKDPTRASPLSYVDRNDAPMLLFQGTKDRLVDPRNTRLMVDALSEAGVPGKAVFMVGLGHGWRTDPYLSSNVRDTERFLDEHLRPERFRSVLSRIEAR